MQVHGLCIEVNKKKIKKLYQIWDLALAWSLERWSLGTGRMVQYELGTRTGYTVVTVIQAPP